MPNQGTAITATNQEAVESVDQLPRSLAIAQAGVRTGVDFANLMSALMSDIIAGRIGPIQANATCNAGSKLLKVVEMQYKYGKPIGGTEEQRVLTLAPHGGYTNGPID